MLLLLGAYVVSTYGGFGLSVSDVISGGLLGHLGPLCLAWGRQPLHGSISLKFSLETRLQSKLFDTLDDLLGFRFKSCDLN